jgi:hypothetical protein
MRYFFAMLFIIILFEGCASSKPPKVYMPTEDRGIAAYYRNGLPIGAIDTNGVLVMVSLEPTELIGKKYMRLWFLYENKTDSAFLLEPMKSVRLNISRDKENFKDIAPESPSTILANIDNEKASKMILQAIGGTLEALSTHSTTVTDPQGGEWTVQDKGDKVKAIANQTATSMANTEMLYDVFKGSINTGDITQKHNISSSKREWIYLFSSACHCYFLKRNQTC